MREHQDLVLLQQRRRSRHLSLRPGFGKQTHRAFQNFLEYARENYMGVSSDGKLEWITNYYDPIVEYKANGGPEGGAATAFMVLPQNRELATTIYEAAANALGWRDPQVPIRANATGLLLARALGDHTAVARLRAAAEREYDPRFFGEHDQKFGWFFGLNEAYPRASGARPCGCPRSATTATGFGRSRRRTWTSSRRRRSRASTFPRSGCIRRGTTPRA